ncbi:MAG TPA: acyl-CoA desaturase [Cyclobacteriaceae bacterium]|nr:acyl-CoA desaturase [Cyclobacteriaceae bacterium]
MNTNVKLKFPEADDFFSELQLHVKQTVTTDVHKKSVRLLWLKLFFYFLLFSASYASLYVFNHEKLFTLVINYILIGLSGILLAFNASHDAAHRTFSRRPWVNELIYTITFNLQGVNGHLWKIRHKSSHHLFPNVDGCDADIDDNPMIRLSPTQPRYWWHRYQHLYATGLYFLYTLHWIFIKDFIYLNKKDLANLRDLKHSRSLAIRLISWKAFYFVYMLALPVYFADSSWSAVLIAFFIMHCTVSIFFVLTLIISHLCMETKFPVADENGLLPYGYHQHQLEVSMDYHPTSRLANWIFGGFNSHSAHHLFPHLPHTLYAKITPLIQTASKKYNYAYNELSLLAGICSHYRYLRKLGKTLN